MSCEGPFFKVKHFPGSLAQPLDAAWVWGQDSHPGRSTQIPLTPSALTAHPMPTENLPQQPTCGHRAGVDEDLGSWESQPSATFRCVGPKPSPLQIRNLMGGVLQIPSCLGPQSLTHSGSLGV